MFSFRLILITEVEEKNIDDKTILNTQTLIKFTLSLLYICLWNISCLRYYDYIA